MRALVLAAGRPPILEMAPAFVPVLDRAVVAHVVDALREAGIDDIVLSLDEADEAVARETFDPGEVRLRPRHGGLRVAGGLRELAGDEGLLVACGHVLGGIEVDALRERFAAGVAEAVVAVDADDRRTGLALLDAAAADRLAEDPGDLARLGTARVVEHRVAGPVVALHDVASVRAAAFAAMAGALRIVPPGLELDTGLVVGEGTSLDGVALIEPPVWIGADVQIGLNTRLHGPLVLGDGATIGDGALLRDVVVLPDATIPRCTLLAGGVAGAQRS